MASYDNSILLDTIKRFPLSEKGMLSSFFGRNRFERLFRIFENELIAVKRADNKVYYALSEDDLHYLPGVSRRELVRKYAVNKFGYQVIKNGVSPCKNADLIFLNSNDKKWYRIWGDMGYLAPESLMLFRAQPLFGSNLVDIIVTAQGGERADFLKTQVELEWTEAGANKVFICDITKGYDHLITPSTNGNGSEFEYDIVMEDFPVLDFSKSNIPKMYNDTKKKTANIQRLRSSDIALKSAELSIFDYDLLRYIACNPFLELKEIGILYSGGYVNRNYTDDLKRESDAIKDTMATVNKLTEMDLLKRLTSNNYMNRYILSWQALDLLGAYHGAIPLYMQKYCQWPQIKFTKEDYVREKKYLAEPYSFFDSHTHYAERWGENLYEHQKLCREFCNAIISGARTLKSSYSVNIEADNVNTVAANLKVVKFINGKRRTKPIHPDGRCTLTKTDIKGTSIYQLFLEIERNTNPKETLIEKIETYKKVIPAAKSFYRNFDDIVLVFFFDDRNKTHGSVNNKIKLLIERMKQAKITGYVSTYSLAISDIPINWVPKYASSEKSITGNMMLYRNIWYSTESENWNDMKPLLGISFQ